MGKRHRNQRQQSGPNTRERVEQLLAKRDLRGAVEAAKLLVREEPGTESEALAVRAYAERIKELIAEGLGREAAATASIVRERFPAHLAPWTALLDDARLAAGDFDWLLRGLPAATEEQRAALEERLVPWIVDPAALARSAVLDPADPLAVESRIVAELFEIVTSRNATPEELTPLGQIRRRSPLASWKLLLRAIDAFHHNEDDRVAANTAALDVRSPAARAGDVLSELTTGRKKPGRTFAAERLVDRISGGRASIAAQIRGIATADKNYDRRRIRDEVRALVKTFDKLSPYALEQARLALLPICAVYFEPGQIAAMFRIAANAEAMERYTVIVMEAAGVSATASWIAYADALLQLGKIEPWQAVEIYFHGLSEDDTDDDPIICTDPSHHHPVPGLAGTAQVIEKIIASRPAPAVLARLTPYLDRLADKELRRVLTAWRKADPEASQPVVRLLRMAEDDRRYDDALTLIRQGDRLKTIDPEYARLRLRLSLRKAEQLLASKKREAAATLLAELAARPEDLGGDAGTYVLALRWAAAPPAVAAELLAELAQRGVPGELALAQVTGALGLPFALPASQPSPEELLEGARRGLALLESAGVTTRHCSWLLERTKPYLDRATEPQLLAIGGAARTSGMIDLAWAATARGLRNGGPMLHRLLLLRAEILMEVTADRRRSLASIQAARTLAERAQDGETAAQATELEYGFYLREKDILSQDQIATVVAYERDAPAPVKREQPRRNPARAKKPKTRKEKGPPQP
jgi:hypothetical protein